MKSFDHENDHFGHYPRFTAWECADGWTINGNPSSITVFDPLGDERPTLIARFAEWHMRDDLKAVGRDLKRARVTTVFSPTLMVRDFIVPRKKFSTLLKTYAIHGLNR